MGWGLLGRLPLPAGADQVGTDAAPKNPLLVQLGNFGGDTNTFALFFTSTAINAGDASAPHRDQRGYLRNGQSDIGAFEFQGNVLNFVSITRSGADITVSFEVVKGMNYILERKLNLTDASWQNLPSGGSLTATGNDTEQITDAGALSNGKVFYHVRFLP